jgi:hypothetical protein
VVSSSSMLYYSSLSVHNYTISDLTTAVGYEVQTWLLDSQFVIHRVEGSGPVLLMYTDSALLMWFKVELHLFETLVPNF